jgi:signal transduction histidine kinase
VFPGRGWNRKWPYWATLLVIRKRSGLRQAREPGRADRRRGTLMWMEGHRRWLTPAGFAVVALVVLANAGGKVGFGTSGRGLVLTVGAGVYAAATTVFLLSFRAPRPATIGLLLVIAAAATAIHHGDPTGPVVGLYLAMAFGPLRLDLRSAAAVAVAGVLVFDVGLAVDHSGVVFMLVVTGGAAFFFFMGTLLRNEHEQRSRADRLVVELEESRAAERAAATVAERARLAREMHDVLAHTLSGLVLQLDGATLLARLEGSDELTATVQRAQTLARDGLVEARDAISALRGDTLPGPERLADLVAEHQRFGGACQLVVTGEPVSLGPDARLAVYRTAQEALSNVRKHAPGAAVDLHLAWSDSGALLVVHDSGGDGHEVLDKSGAGYGLAGMSERAALLGGRLDAGPAHGGFRVELHVPAAVPA